MEFKHLYITNVANNVYYSSEQLNHLLNNTKKSKFHYVLRNICDNDNKYKISMGNLYDDTKAKMNELYFLSQFSHIFKNIFFEQSCESIADDFFSEKMYEYIFYDFDFIDQKIYEFIFNNIEFFSQKYNTGILLFLYKKIPQNPYYEKPDWACDSNVFLIDLISDETFIKIFELFNRNKDICFDYTQNAIQNTGNGSYNTLVYGRYNKDISSHDFTQLCNTMYKLEKNTFDMYVRHKFINLFQNYDYLNKLQNVDLPKTIVKIVNNTIIRDTYKHNNVNIINKTLFTTRFNEYTCGLLDDAIDEGAWNNIYFAGGGLFNILNNTNSNNSVLKNSDIDLFLTGKMELQKQNAISIIKKLVDKFGKNVKIYKFENYSNIIEICVKNKRKIQLIFSYETTIENIVNVFDIPCYKVYYDGTNVYCNIECYYSYKYWFCTENIKLINDHKMIKGLTRIIKTLKKGMQYESIQSDDIIPILATNYGFVHNELLSEIDIPDVNKLYWVSGFDNGYTIVDYVSENVVSKDWIASWSITDIYHLVTDDNRENNEDD